jgi:hypothetical protein
MARIQLTNGFTVLPEGEYTFTIKEVSYNEDFGKMEIKCETTDGQKHTERYNFLKKDGSQNDGAFTAFSIFARKVLNNPELQELDEQDLVGGKFVATVKHEKVPSTNDPNKELTFVRLENVESYITDGDAVEYEEIDADEFDDIFN